MKNRVKKSISLLLAVIMLLCVAPVTDISIRAGAITFSQLNDPSVFLKQAGSTTCTLCATTMMLRRYSMLRGDSNWNTITESSVRSPGWIDGTGLRWSFSYSNSYVRSISVGHGTLPGGSSNASTLIEMLKKCPEGIVIYNTSVPHAVLLTDYTDGVFYCADPLGSYPSGRIPLTSSYKVRIDNVTAYWKVTSPVVPGPTGGDPAETVPDIAFFNITKADNSDSGLSSDVPTLNGQYKYWFKKNTDETNYYINLYIDNQLVRDHDSTDSSGFYSYIVDTSLYSNGEHIMKLVYAYPSGCVTVEKKFVVNNGIIYFGISTPDNADWSLSDIETPTISGEYKFWFKKLISDTNYYVNIFVDNQLVLDHGTVDDSGYVSYVVNSAYYSNGAHEIKAVLAHSTGAETAVKKFNVENGIINFGISTPDNTDWSLSDIETPTISGEYKFWFKKLISGTNYYVNIFVDNQLVLDHGTVDDAGYVSYVVNSAYYSNGAHEIKAVLSHSDGAETAVKKFNVENGIIYFGISTPDNSDWNLSDTETPTISGEYKLWFKKLISDTNYYVNIFVDNQLVLDHGTVDDAGYVSYVVKSPLYADGTHEIKAVLTHSIGVETAIKKFTVSNIKYNVTFNSNGGSCSTTSISVISGSTYGTLPTPTRSGYTFDGWYTAASGGTRITSETIVSSTGDHTLYAHWSCNHVSTEVRDAKSATCTAKGYTGDTYCLGCGVITLKGKEIAAKGHSFDSGKITTSATCNSTGVKTYTCTVCKATKTETLPKNPSNHAGGTAVKNALAATCTAKGYTGDTYCLGCGVVTVKGKEIAATGHTDTNNDGKCDICSTAVGTPSEPEKPDTPSETCNHICHKSGIARFFYLIARLFWKMFKTNKYCSCGAAHY